MNKDRIKSLLETMCKGAFEREETIALSLLSSLAGESIFLLGLPGDSRWLSRTAPDLNIS